MADEGAPRCAYLDHAASTPMLDEVRECIVRELGRHANPSGVHRAARAARRVVDEAREAVAAAVGARPEEVVFTSGGTEADNLAITGAAPGARVVVSAVEHDAVLRPAARRAAAVCPVDKSGRVDLDALRDLVDGGVGLVSVMAVNNEVGTVEPLDAVVEIVRDRAPDALVHTDAVQAMPWCDVAAAAARCDLVTISGHKIGGPKGVGALVVRARARGALSPVLLGGPQEGELRAGTENVAAVAGFGLAAAITSARRDAACARVGALRDRFVDAVVAAVPGAYATVDRTLVHPGSAHLAFPGAVNEELLFALDDEGVAASAGAACASGAVEPSHVLAAMGLDAETARSCVRFSLGSSSTQNEIDDAAAAVGRAHARVTAGAPAWT